MPCSLSASCSAFTLEPGIAAGDAGAGATVGAEVWALAVVAAPTIEAVRASAVAPSIMFLSIVCMASLLKAVGDRAGRSEEHTSELQSLMRISYAVFCLKKKKKIQRPRKTLLQQKRMKQP